MGKRSRMEVYYNNIVAVAAAEGHCVVELTVL